MVSQSSNISSNKYKIHNVEIHAKREIFLSSFLFISCSNVALLFNRLYIHIFTIFEIHVSKSPNPKIKQRIIFIKTNISTSN